MHIHGNEIQAITKSTLDNDHTGTKLYEVDVGRHRIFELMKKTQCHFGFLPHIQRIDRTSDSMSVWAWICVKCRRLHLVVLPHRLAQDNARKGTTLAVGGRNTMERFDSSMRLLVHDRPAQVVMAQVTTTYFVSAGDKQELPEHQAQTEVRASVLNPPRLQQRPWDTSAMVNMTNIPIDTKTSGKHVFQIVCGL